MKNSPDLLHTLTGFKFGDGNPLFDSVADLAGVICAISKDRYPNRKQGSMSAILSNVFRHVRGCSQGLQNEILLAVDSRIAHLPENERVYIAAHVKRAVEKHNEVFGEPATKSHELADAEIFFQKLSRHGALLIVEYRDLPRAAPDAKYRNFATKAGEAIAQGLNFAMMQPFSEDIGKTTGSFYHTTNVRDYLGLLVRRTREAYLSMLKAALDNRGGQSPQEIARRLVLFECTSDIKANSSRDSKSVNALSFFHSSIQSRVFFAEFPLGNRLQREIWEWIAGQSNDFFIQRDENSMPPHVFAEQFFFVSKFWRMYKRIPAIDSEIRKSIEFWNSKLGAKLPARLWKVFATPERALELVKQEFAVTKL